MQYLKITIQCGMPDFWTHYLLLVEICNLYCWRMPQG